jgi:hypothetical protein
MGTELRIMIHSNCKFNVIFHKEVKVILSYVAENDVNARIRIYRGLLASHVAVYQAFQVLSRCYIFIKYIC